jgi:hypothetical protein
MFHGGVSVSSVRRIQYRLASICRRVQVQNICCATNDFALAASKRVLAIADSSGMRYNQGQLGDLRNSTDKDVLRLLSTDDEYDQKCVASVSSAVSVNFSNANAGWDDRSQNSSVALSINSNFQDRVPMAAIINDVQMPMVPMTTRSLGKTSLLPAPSAEVQLDLPSHSACHCLSFPSSFDGTPTPAVTKQQLTKNPGNQPGSSTAAKSPPTQLVACGLHAQTTTTAIALTDSASTVTTSFKAKTKQAHSFMQRGGMLTYDPQHGTSYRPIAMAPTAIADNTARTLLRVVGFPWLVHRAVKETLRKSDVLSSIETLLTVIPLCFDAASSNLLFFAYCANYYAQMNIALNFACVVFLTSVLCIAHQINLSSLAGIACVGGDTTAECDNRIKN